MRDMEFPGKNGAEEERNRIRKSSEEISEKEKTELEESDGEVPLGDVDSRIS